MTGTRCSSAQPGVRHGEFGRSCEVVTLAFDPLGISTRDDDLIRLLRILAYFFPLRTSESRSFATGISTRCSCFPPLSHFTSVSSRLHYSSLSLHSYIRPSLHIAAVTDLRGRHLQPI